MRRVLAIVALCLSVLPAWAIEPDELLDDPGLEARARAISAELRCLVCRNESIDESNADIAKDLRLLVRERLLAGDDDDAVIDFIVARYGEYVLLRPNTGGANLVLWASGPVMALIALLLVMVYLRGRARARARGGDALSKDEQKRLDEILRK